MSLWEFIEKLTRENRWKTIIALFLLVTISLSLVGLFVVASAYNFWPGGVEIIPSAGSIKLLQENRQYKMQLVHPFGWQNTDVEFESGQTANISAGGMVTVGYVEQFWDNFSYRAGDRCIEVRGRFARPVPDCIAARSEDRPSPNIKWPWVGPAGYDLEIYKDPRYKWVSREGDKPPMVNGITHGTLVGVIRPKGQLLAPDDAVPRSEVFELGKTSTMTANTKGVLWVGVNDGGAYFHDNLGFFSLTITTQATQK